ncbi:MAG: hypothetical protein KKG33_10365 [candidate division Zixibacteria bacterium]|nr:hypothetical protein [candidate division Zixibacteria bacterium]MBU1470190.1 hypothetical protein [candidate division Zixibacteria bacterium]MBU2625951.1 hypothetical protein [candidate division Zixibacteria bacterium]
MSAVKSWHSVKEDCYHNNEQCTRGWMISKLDRLEGTGDKSQCVVCRVLNERARELSKQNDETG